MEPEDVVGVLPREPVALTVAQQPAASCGAPSEPGLYVRWAARKRWTESARPA